MAGWHHRLDGCEFEWTPGVGDGRRGLVCHNSWGPKESDMTEQLPWTDILFVIHLFNISLLEQLFYDPLSGCLKSPSTFPTSVFVPRKLGYSEFCVKFSKGRCRRPRCGLLFGKNSWGRERPPIPVFLPGDLEERTKSPSLQLIQLIKGKPAVNSENRGKCLEILWFWSADGKCNLIDKLRINWGARRPG